MPSSPLLALEAIRSGYGRIEVLHGIALEVLPGEVVSLIGPNGAGKTTLLGTISGLIRPSAGSIRFRGDAITGLRPHLIARRGLGHCPEGRRIFQRLSVEENLVAGFLPGRGRSYAAARDEAYALFPILAERRASLASRLSGGQQQMLAIGRALMGRPDLLMLDEPSLGLAPIAVNQVFEIVLRLAETGVAVLLVEQNVSLALEVADFAYAMENGAIVASGPADALRADPRIAEIYLPEAREGRL
jgi:branched-chain amino acid transport system ATP-binding protein